MDCALTLVVGAPARGRPVKLVSESLGVSRSQLTARIDQASEERRPRRRRRLDDAALVDRIRGTVSDLPSYGYRRVWALLRWQVEQQINAKRVYRVMRDHGLLLERRCKQPGVARRHDGRVAVETSNTRWCSDGFEFRCDDGDRLRITFALDCCDREAISVGLPALTATAAMMFAMSCSRPLRSASARRCRPRRSNGSAYTTEQTRAFAREIGLLPLTTPVCSPQSNSMAESFVKTMKRDYIAHMPRPDRLTARRNLEIVFQHYNEEHPHSALNYRSPREFRQLTATST